MAEQKKAQTGFIDLSNEPSDDENANQRTRRPRHSLVSDKPKGLTCWKCKQGTMLHKKYSMVRGSPVCTTCGKNIKKGNLTVCTDAVCAYVWCRECWRKENHEENKKVTEANKDDEKSNK